jgi:hypothetical protein
MINDISKEPPVRPILPIGFPLGLFHGEADRAGSVAGLLRLGDSVEELPADRYRTWALAFDTRPRDELVSACQSAGLGDVSAAIDELIGAGLLIQLDDESVNNVRLLEQYRLLPAGLATGNTPSQPERFGIATPGGATVLYVDLSVLGVWSFSARAMSIADACRQFVDRTQIEVGSVTDQFALNLPFLVRAGVAFLDVL